MKTDAECKALAHRMADVLIDGNCSPVDAVRVTSGFMVALIMALANSKEDAFDGWAELTEDARRTISTKFDEQRLGN